MGNEDQDFEIMAVLGRVDSDVAEIRGSIYSLCRHKREIAAKAAAGELTVGLRGYSEDGSICLELRPNSEISPLLPRKPTEFSFRALIKDITNCRCIEISLLVEGERWCNDDGRGTEYLVESTNREGGIRLRPKYQYNDSLFGGSDEAKILYAIYYLEEILSRFGVDVALDFTWSYFLGRQIDLLGYQSTATSINRKESYIGDIVKSIILSEEYLHKVLSSILENPYTAIGKWAEIYNDNK